MKSISILTLGLLTLAGTALAQTTTSSTMGFGATPGSREFSIGGNGATNTEFNNSFGGINFSLGQYTNDASFWALRQSVLYTNPLGDDIAWSGSTRIAYDYHLMARDRLRPFVGVNFGGVYGEGFDDTWAAGLEIGAKHYVQQRAFIFGLVEYGWFFDRVRQTDDSFSDGQFNWSVGMGFNF